MYKIGMFSKINKVTVKTLRYYDEMGLLKPAFVDQFTGYRYYTSEQLPVLHKIIALRQIGFSIDEVLLILKGNNPAELFEKRRTELAQLIEESNQQLSQITHYLEKMKEDKGMDYEVVLKELPQAIVASMRTTIPNYDAFNSIYPEMGAYMQEQKVRCAQPEYCFTIYHDGEYKEENIDVEICQAVTDYAKDSEKVKFKKIGKVETAACVMHKGPYSTIGNAYNAVFRWAEDNGYIVSDNPRESYIDGIWNKEDPNEWLTEVQVPLIKK